MDEDRVVLDRRSFEALAVDTRVRILKSLKERRKTLSEISKEQRMSVSGVKEHLETLEGVGLITRIDDGHKWKYYELTRKGADIVAPKELRVWILLSLSVIALAASMTAMLWPGAPYGSEGAAPFETGAAGAERLLAAAPEAPAQETDAAFAKEAPDGTDSGNVAAEGDAGILMAESLPEPRPDMSVPLAVGAVSALTLLVCAGILVRNRTRRA